MDESTYTTLMTNVAQAFEIVAAGILVVGLVLTAYLAIRAGRREQDGKVAYRVARQAFGGVILLGLEVLVAGDLIRTVAIAPTLENVGVLGLIVLIRTFLSFSLEIEIEGVPPWRKGLVSGATIVKKAASTASGA